jgi:hypothetical protein
VGAGGAAPRATASSRSSVGIVARSCHDRDQRAGRRVQDGGQHGEVASNGRPAPARL